MEKASVLAFERDKGLSVFLLARTNKRTVLQPIGIQKQPLSLSNDDIFVKTNEHSFEPQTTKDSQLTFFVQLGLG